MSNQEDFNRAANELSWRYRQLENTIDVIKEHFNSISALDNLRRAYDDLKHARNEYEKCGKTYETSIDVKVEKLLSNIIRKK